ncbi:hypothetical protein FHS51_000454 [Sphingobium wenxiniae]|uniref:Lipoprotein n=1 Tax=Sphingobium wenxiniae (strain DSM 21828 / CGMCC 1.7748 / JZ-1) TaxID=595605 RepID=A0A562KPX7_SPHWJ|nr:hypothetical protein [Sphingobium wenxiniae]MBB6190251.1 hypothetical protein [Sphingobium wenxiniae]TWH97434.1 hypothetical protein IQ35_00028 [Sphingobium wenxiniae]
MRRTSLILLLLLAACQRTGGPDQAEDRTNVPSASGLERAAIASGVIADAGKISPVGLFQRSHEAGRDLLCIAPVRDGTLRFGLEAIFGAEQHCHGQGSARRAGDKLILRFDAADQCIIVAQYDGDQVALPGVVDMKCADLCDGRGSLEGVSFPRIAGQAGPALAARDRAGEPLCGPD